MRPRTIDEEAHWLPAESEVLHGNHKRNKEPTLIVFFRFYHNLFNWIKIFFGKVVYFSIIIGYTNQCKKNITRKRRSSNMMMIKGINAVQLHTTIRPTVGYLSF
ncbi:hypothetical protein VL03_13700 [Rossellomorea marisflavi]|nr:hypothetical protein VL03_13700 [Rossellomorea marisflavi]